MCRAALSLVVLSLLDGTHGLRGATPPQTRSVTHHCSPAGSTRREAVFGALSSALSISAATLIIARPTAAHAAKKNSLPPVKLQDELVLILRVKEATSQEARLIKTGKYKELQRLNIKRAISFMLDNYELQQRFVRATAFAPADKIASASQFGNTAVESLVQVLEYFPQDLVANDLTPEQKKFCLQALSSTSSSIDGFIALMPEAAAAAAAKQIAEENELNEAEFDGAQYLNAPAVATNVD